MPQHEELQPLLSEPREALDAEYKGWLNLTENEHRAVLAKAAIALANHGGGYIVIGFEEREHAFLSSKRPEGLTEITQDDVNAAIRRYATPEFHCDTHRVTHPETGNIHPVIVVPGNLTEPVMSRRDCPNVIMQNRCYIRKPGPRSEEPQTAEEWRTLLQRCLRAGREDMLEAIRSIVSGRVAPTIPERNVASELHAFIEESRRRWEVLTSDLPPDAPARFPLGYYEMGFLLVGARPFSGLSDLQDRLEVARRIRLTGWSTFLSMTKPGLGPYAHGNAIEAWVGRPVDDDPMAREPAFSDFWRASPDGKLYTIRGYKEDSLPDRARPGSVIDVTLPVWRVGEGLLFAARLAEAFEDVEAIAIECRFTGLRNRTMVSVTGDRAMFDNRVSQSDEIAMTSVATSEQIRDNLAEIMHALLAPLYERFDLLRLPFELVDTELTRLRNGRF